MARNLQIFLFTAVPSVLILAALFARFMARRALKPISRIIAIARDIGQGQELSKRIPVLKIKDELGQLALTFNEMMNRLENSFNKHRLEFYDTESQKTIFKSPLKAHL